MNIPNIILFDGTLKATWAKTQVFHLFVTKGLMGTTNILNLVQCPLELLVFATENAQTAKCLTTL